MKQEAETVEQQKQQNSGLRLVPLMQQIQKEIQRQLVTQSVSANELASESGVNYVRLENLLKAGQWKEADKETYEVMIRAVGKKSGAWFISDALLNFPCKDLKTIDVLWVNSSNGRFGFSVQKQIYVECGAKLDGKYPGREIWEKFGERVGWRKDGTWLAYLDLNPSLSSPDGIFPLGRGGVGGFRPISVRGGWNRRHGGAVRGLFSRIKACKV